MNPEFPLAPENPIGQPAPFWFLLLFKVLGFTLHQVPMHIWYAGMVLVVLFSLFGGEHARRLAHRLINALPVLIALGINFGIVPLLFIQVGYYPVVYPANILIGWFWFAVIPLLIVAYYGVYYYAVQVRHDRVDWRGVLAGIASCACFLAIGFIFANNFSLMTNREQMLAIYDRTSVGGAVTGMALNTDDPTLFPRWLMMFGLAITTTAVYILIDTVFFAKAESDAYRAWAARFAPLLYLIGVVWFAVMGAQYIFGALRPEIRAAAQANTAITILFGATAVLPGAVWILSLLASRSLRASMAWATALAQFVVLALNAISRQWVQNREVAAFFDPAKLAVKTQWSPMIVFLALFIVGVGVVAWMLRQLIVGLRASAANQAVSPGKRGRGKQAPAR